MVKTIRKKPYNILGTAVCCRAFCINIMDFYARVLRTKRKASCRAIEIYVGKNKSENRNSLCKNKNLLHPSGFQRDIINFDIDGYA